MTKIIKEEKKVVTSTIERDPQVVQQQPIYATSSEPKVVVEQQIRNPDGSVTIVKKEVQEPSMGDLQGAQSDNVEAKMQMEKKLRKSEGAGVV